MDARPAIEWRMEALSETTLQVEKWREGRAYDQWRSYKKDDIIDLANGREEEADVKGLRPKTLNWIWGLAGSTLQDREGPSEH